MSFHQPSLPGPPQAALTNQSMSPQYFNPMSKDTTFSSDTNSCPCYIKAPSMETCYQFRGQCKCGDSCQCNGCFVHDHPGYIAKNRNSIGNIGDYSLQHLEQGYGQGSENAALPPGWSELLASANLDDQEDDPSWVNTDQGAGANSHDQTLDPSSLDAGIGAGADSGEQIEAATIRDLCEDTDVYLGLGMDAGGQGTRAGYNEQGIRASVGGHDMNAGLDHQGMAMNYGPGNAFMPGHTYGQDLNAPPLDFSHIELPEPYFDGQPLVGGSGAGAPPPDEQIYGNFD